MGALRNIFARIRYGQALKRARREWISAKAAYEAARSRRDTRGQNAAQHAVRAAATRCVALETAIAGRAGR